MYLEELVNKDSTLTEHYIKNIHHLVLKEIYNENAGCYRTENVVISGATYIPPNYLIARDQMEKLPDWLSTWTKMYHPLVVSTLLHGEFVKIHPFVDGNGRTARLLMNFVTMQNGYPPLIIKKEQRIEYYDALDMAHTTGNYTAFVALIMKLADNALDFYLSVIEK